MKITLRVQRYNPERDAKPYYQDYALDVAPTDPSVVYTSFALGFPPIPVYRTTDFGSSWSTHVTPMSCGNACGIRVSPADASRVFALEGTVT